MSSPMVLKPRVSEKAYAFSEKQNTFIFVVPSSATKLSVKSAIEAQFKVSVTNVNVTNIKGKSKRLYRRGDRKATPGRRSDIKKAFVTLKEGDKLPIFAALEESQKPAENTSKKARKEAK